LPEIATTRQGVVTCDWTIKMNDYILHQRGETEKTWMYFYMPSIYTVGDIGTKHVVIKPAGNGRVLRVCMHLRTYSNF
jgi:hypothetical protein